ncbi:Rad52/22 family double-strand break repair protein [Cetobacterium ceti]|uniref:Rad52/22 family double-strand break repair protein n=1 Tax=Cetobacterium ceti TaxID=180163 RepID=A0A1T4QYC5_9FUSO|nr:Rad52/Rad22 family DNA repair protein [Cetobacterium ceti]SKA08730.1 Rad52/22 family double-strand break repair protein [Cetobacterium ceti]
MDIKRELEKKFDNVKWRVQSCGLSSNSKKWARLTPYLDINCIIERLDSLFGWDGWQSKEFINENHSVTVELKLWSDKRNEWITRAGTSDIVEKNSQALSENAIKSAATSAFKRAAACFGIGLYLKEIKEVWGKEVSPGTPGSYKCENKKNNLEFYVVPDTDKIKNKLFETKENIEITKSENIIPLVHKEKPILTGESEIGKEKAMILASEIKKEFPTNYKKIIEDFKAYFKIDKLEKLSISKMERIRKVDYQIAQYKFSYDFKKVN